MSGKAGNRIALRTAGTNGPPVVLVHGWAQSSRCWPSELAMGSHCLAVDLPGHGESDGVDDYADGAGWAADLAAVLATLDEPAVLVGWSYGGVVITDYLRHCGTVGVRGLLFAGAVTELGRGHPGGRVGSVMRAAMPDVFSAEPDVAVPALNTFLAGMSVRKMPGRLHQSMLADALRLDPQVRAALFARDVGSAEVLASVDVPTVLVHGEQDAVVSPTAGEYAADLVPGATLYRWQDVGHLPFVERTQEFHAVLARLLAL